MLTTGWTCKPTGQTSVMTGWTVKVAWLDFASTFAFENFKRVWLWKWRGWFSQPRLVDSRYKLWFFSQPHLSGCFSQPQPIVVGFLTATKRGCNKCGWKLQPQPNVLTFQTTTKFGCTLNHNQMWLHFTTTTNCGFFSQPNPTKSFAFTTTTKYRQTLNPNLGENKLRGAIFRRNHSLWKQFLICWLVIDIQNNTKTKHRQQ